MNDSSDIPFRFLLFFRDERIAAAAVVVVFDLIVRSGGKIWYPFLLKQNTSKRKIECGNQKKATYMYCLCCSIVANIRDALKERE